MTTFAAGRPPLHVVPDPVDTPRSDSPATLRAACEIKADEVTMLALRVGEAGHTAAADALLNAVKEVSRARGLV